MIVKDKVGLMSKMAIFEKSKSGKAVLKDISFFRSDHIRWALLKTLQVLITKHSASKF